jgi:hypothetical protein
VFQLNRSNLENLLRLANTYDFAILVFTPDDSTTSRGKRNLGPRDNVLFEHGLFMGRLGPNRAFIICEEGVKMPSDFAGISITTYRSREDGNLTSAVSDACNLVREAINAQREHSEITFLPSTALAIGYHENFINKVVDVLMDNRRKSARESGIKKIVKQRQADGSEKDKSIPLTYDDFVLRVFVPTDDLSQLEPRGLKNTVQNLIQISLQTPFRPFPFYIRANEKETEHASVLELFDIPTTMLASRKAIQLLLGESYLGENKDEQKLEKREALNFYNALNYLINKTYGKEENHPYLEVIKVPTLASLPSD